MNLLVLLAFRNLKAFLAWRAKELFWQISLLCQHLLHWSELKWLVRSFAVPAVQSHVFRPLKASERLTRPLKHFSQQYLINIDLLTHFLLIFFPLFSALPSELGMNWEWMSTSNLTWPLLMGSLSLGIRATPSLAMGAAMCHRDIQLSMHLTTDQVLPTNKFHRKVRGWKYKMTVNDSENVYDRLSSFNRALSSIS